jgi:SAM-dependent methyltransferase
MPTAERALLHRGGRRGTWGSLGLWLDEDDDYAGACEALALAVARSAGVQRGSRVLSVACGAGDELRMLAERCGAAQVQGVEIDATLVHQAQQLLSRRAALASPAAPHIVLHLGSGTALHTLGLPVAGFDQVLCVDAAYHLEPRQAFLQGAWQALRPGGWLAYTDLCIETTGGRRLTLLRAAARCCGLGAHTLLPADAQGQRLREAGFIDVRAQRLDDAVLGGFARFVRAQGPRVARTGLHRDWRRPALTARLIGPCRAAGLGYVLLCARKPADASGAADAAIASATA